MTAKSTQKETLSTMLIGRWEQIGHKVAALAEEFPEESFEYRPLESVRTFGDVLRHLAFWNQYVADSLSGKQVDDSSNEVPLVNYPTKARIVEVLERSSREAVAALGKHPSDLDLKTVELMMTFIEHSCEHYGQLVVYSRLMGITPPASRAQS
jgi:uncharacterized damage-inducible protein DinB